MMQFRKCGSELMDLTKFRLLVRLACQYDDTISVVFKRTGSKRFMKMCHPTRAEAELKSYIYYKIHLAQMQAFTQMMEISGFIQVMS